MIKVEFKFGLLTEVEHPEYGRGTVAAMEALYNGIGKPAKIRYTVKFRRASRTAQTVDEGTLRKFVPPPTEARVQSLTSNVGAVHRALEETAHRLGKQMKLPIVEAQRLRELFKGAHPTVVKFFSDLQVYALASQPMPAAGELNKPPSRRKRRAKRAR